MVSPMATYDTVSQSAHVDHSPPSLLRMKNLKSSLGAHAAHKDLHELEHDIAGQLEDNKNRINYFEELNWHDPFPHAEEVQPSAPSSKSKHQHSSSRAKHAERRRRASLIDKTHIHMLVYDASKFTERAPPSMVFLPNKVVLRKMMKVCAQVELLTDLYFFF